MLENLLVAAIVVIVLWIIILLIFLAVSRKQPDVRSQMQALEEQLNHAENDPKTR
jgi:hypothetical protein